MCMHICVRLQVSLYVCVSWAVLCKHAFVFDVCVCSSDFCAFFLLMYVYERNWLCVSVYMHLLTDIFLYAYGCLYGYMYVFRETCCECMCVCRYLSRSNRNKFEGFFGKLFFSHKHILQMMSSFGYRIENLQELVYFALTT